jgi:hypothetical protein
MFDEQHEYCACQLSFYLPAGCGEPQLKGQVVNLRRLDYHTVLTNSKPNAQIATFTTALPS